MPIQGIYLEIFYLDVFYYYSITENRLRYCLIIKAFLVAFLGIFVQYILHKMSVASIGYSTALFATIGILCGFQAGNQFNSKSIFFYTWLRRLHYWLYWERAMKGQIMQLISVD